MDADAVVLVMVMVMLEDARPRDLFVTRLGRRYVRRICTENMMADAYTNQVFAYGPETTLTEFLNDRIGRAGEVSEWVATTSRTSIRHDWDVNPFLEIIFEAGSRDLEELFADLTQRHQDIVITHAAADPANGIAYASVWSGGFVVGEHVMDAADIESYGHRDAVFDALLSAVDAREKDAIRGFQSELAR